MSRRSAARVLALTVVLAELVLGGVLFTRLPPAIRSPLVARRPPAGPTSSGPATAPPRLVGTYWTCESNEGDGGTVTAGRPPPSGAVRSRLCDFDYGRQGPGQPRPSLPRGIRIWRVPVGTFTPFHRCGVMVMNVVDPYDTQAAPATWPRPHELLYDARWHQVRPGSC